MVNGCRTLDVLGSVSLSLGKNSGSLESYSKLCLFYLENAERVFNDNAIDEK